MMSKILTEASVTDASLQALVNLGNSGGGRNSSRNNRRNNSSSGGGNGSSRRRSFSRSNERTPREGKSGVEKDMERGAKMKKNTRQVARGCRHYKVGFCSFCKSHADTAKARAREKEGRKYVKLLQPSIIPG